MKRCLCFMVLLFVLVGFQSVWGEPSTSYGFVQGVITNPEGGNLPNTHVTAEVDTGVVWSDYTDYNGQYTLLINLGNEDSLIVDVIADKDNYNPDSSLNVIVKFMEIDIINFSLEHEYGPVQGKVTDLTFGVQMGIENVYVSVIGEPSKSTYTDGEGEYVLNVRDYSEDGYDISFSHDEYMDATVHIEVGLPRFPLHMALDRVNWYVAMDGDDYSGIGSFDYPFATIQTGVDYAEDDDTVYVKPGTMSGTDNREIVLDDKKIVVKSLEGNEVTFIDIAASPPTDLARAFDIRYDRGSVISGFTIMNGYGPADGGGIWCRLGGNPTIDNCVFKNNNTVASGGAIAVQSTSIEVHATITNCVFYDNEATEEGGGIYVYRVARLTVENCTITRNSAPAQGSGIAIISSNGNSITNCISWGNSSDQLYLYQASVDVSYCDIGGGWAGIGNINENPLFCDAFNDDFHLAQNSVCLTAGEGGTAMGAFPDYGCLQAGGIFGTVTELEFGLPLDNVLVTATSSRGTERQGETDSDGNYEIVIPDAIDGDNANVHFDRLLYDTVTVNVEFNRGSPFAQLDVVLEKSICGNYVIGDFNGSTTFNVSDIIAASSKLKTGSPDSYMECECPVDSGNEWAAVMDVNNSCTFNIADVIAAFSKLKTGLPVLIPCEDCSPSG
ncbi:MAG: right-handed parallel beta-helix repeat-containing protein [candidate division Zixibacteria bacterium]